MASTLRMSTARPPATSSAARSRLPVARIASWGQVGTQMPQRVHAASTMATRSADTATASEGQTRTHARQATHRSGSMRYSTGSGNRVLLDLPVERALADAEHFGGFAAVAVRLLQRCFDCRALHVGHRHPR